MLNLFIDLLNKIIIKIYNHEKNVSIKKIRVISISYGSDVFL